jgi:four helix bundle protein
MAKIERFEEVKAWQEARRLGSASEVQSQMYVALDLGYVKKIEFDECYDKAADTAKLVVGFIKYLSDD